MSDEKLSTGYEPQACVHPWEHVGVNADGHPFCAECGTNLTKDPPWKDVPDQPPLSAEQQMAQDAGDMVDPAYWRGHDDAVRGVADRWREALECPIPKPGVMQEPLESLYRRTEALRASQPPSDVLEALKQANELCRSSYQVCKRVVDQYGAVTSGVNFGALKDSLERSLIMQHAVITKHGASETKSGSPT